MIDDKLERFRALQLFSESKHTMLFEGWVESGKIQRLKNVIELATKNTCFFETSEAKEDEQPPTLLANPSILKPFETITESYGLPSYNEIDPTPLTAITFTLIFGLMFADAGYGLSLTILSLFTYIYTTKESRLRRNINLMLVYLGLSSLFFGLLFGEFFGIKFREGPFNPLEDIKLFLLISLLIGGLHITIGILSKITTSGKGIKGLMHPLSLILIIWSSFLLYYFRDSLLNKILLLAGLLLLLWSKKLGAFKDIISLFSATISYARIAVLSIMHIVINRLLISYYYKLSTTPEGIIIFSVLFITSSLIILIAGTFISALQALRLHWVEFFSQFFFGRGA